MKSLINGSFIVLLGASGLLLTRLHGAEYETVLAAGTVPLTLHFAILLANVKEITKKNIDNVYYFGFLITIISLAISANNFTQQQEMDLNLIVKQFSVGLVATGLALMYKLILQGIYKDPEEEELIQKHADEMERFTQEAGKMFFQLQLACNSLTELANNSFKAVNDNYVISKENLKELHTESLGVISSTLEQAVGDNFANLKNHGDDAGQALKLLSEQMTTIVENTSFKKFGTTLSKLETSLGDFSSSVDGTVSRIEDSTSRVERHHGEMESLVIQANSATASLLEFRKKIEQDTVLSDNAKMLFDKKLTDQSREIAKSFQELTQAINRLSANLPPQEMSRENKAG